MLIDMSKASILLTVIALGAAALFAQDADVAKYQASMKAAAGAVNAARTAVTAKDSAAIKENAGKAADAFGDLAKFWSGKHKDDAQKFAETARDASKALAAASTPEEQNAALQSIQGTCRGCHTIYRDGTNIKGL